MYGHDAKNPRPTLYTKYYRTLPGQCHTVISNLAITRIIFNLFYNAAVYTAYSEPTMHCMHSSSIYQGSSKPIKSTRAAG